MQLNKQNGFACLYIYIMDSHFYICRLLQKRNVVHIVTIYVSNQRYIIMSLKMYIIKIEKTFQSKHFKCQMYQNTLFFSHVIIFLKNKLFNSCNETKSVTPLTILNA